MDLPTLLNSITTLHDDHDLCIFLFSSSFVAAFLVSNLQRIFSEALRACISVEFFGSGRRISLLMQGYILKIRIGEVCMIFDIYIAEEEMGPRS